MSYVIDKKLWRDGPWQSEPDFAYAIYKGHPLVLIRNFSSGSWLGYIGIDPKSKFISRNYDRSEVDLVDVLEVHGGVTFTSKGERFYQIIMQYNLGDILADIKEDFKSYFWIGFDCAHFDDIAPGFKSISKIFENDEYAKSMEELTSHLESLFDRKHATYKDIEFAKSELTNLVDQVIEINKE